MSQETVRTVVKSIGPYRLLRTEREGHKTSEHWFVEEKDVMGSVYIRPFEIKNYGEKEFTREAEGLFYHLVKELPYLS